MKFNVRKEKENSLPITERYPWVKRRLERERLVSEYLKQFKAISTIYSDAQANGYDLDLLNYVHAVADVQAQIMLPEQSGIGWDGIVIFGADATFGDEEVKRFLSDQKRQVETGIIDVAIPTGRLVAWKAMAEWKKLQPKPKEKAITPILEKTRLDLEIERQMNERLSA